MNQEEKQQFINSIDQMTAAINKGLDILQENSTTLSSMMDDMMTNLRVEPFPLEMFSFGEKKDESDKDISLKAAPGESIEDVAERVAEAMFKKNEQATVDKKDSVVMYSLSLQDSTYDPLDVMDIVQNKLNQKELDRFEKTEVKEDKGDDDFNFESLAH